jgi:hypothetical protein
VGASAGVGVWYTLGTATDAVSVAVSVIIGGAVVVVGSACVSRLGILLASVGTTAAAAPGNDARTAGGVPDPRPAAIHGFRTNMAACAASYLATASLSTRTTPAANAASNRLFSAFACAMG